MKKHRIRLVLFVALLATALPALSDDAKDTEPLPEEDTILGTWYMQVMEGEVVPADDVVRIVFEDNGVVRVFEGGDEDEVAGYIHDEKQSRITIYEQDDPADIEAVIKYSFIDDMLVMRMNEGRGGAEEEERFEFSRKPEGTKRHQAMRKELGDQPTHKQRMIEMRQLFVAAMTYQVEHNDMPASIGDMVVGNYITPESAVSKPAQEKLPKDFEDWEKQAKIDWINQHTGCVYIKLIINPQVDVSKRVAIFEVPANKEQEKITLVLGDGSSELRAYKEADRKIKKQTGHTLEQWMKTTSPGSGKMVLPEKKDEDEDKSKAPAE